MPYYTGDYYRGDYYKGDPGFFSFLGGLGKSLLGGIPVVGPALSTVAGAVSEMAAKPAARAALPVAATSGAGAIVKATGARALGALKAHPVLTAAGAAGVAGAAMGAGGAKLLARRAGMRKHRRMRVTNPKALRRAIRRTQGFAKLAMRTIHLVHPKKHARFGGFRKRSRKKC